ncbi:MAG: HAMP domain-containing sensor histidine kinase [Nitriliruptoraceae bacterium]
MTGQADDSAPRDPDVESAVTAAIAHQIRTPLTMIVGAAETLAQRRDALAPSAINAMIDRLRDNAYRLAGVVDDLVEFLVVPDAVTVQRRDTSLHVLARRAAKRTSITRDRLHLPDVPVVLDVDPELIGRAFDRVFDNVARHTPRDTSVWVDADVGAAGIAVHIGDNGPGIPAVSDNALFAPFVSIDPGDPSPRPGLGLPLVARYARAHGGRAHLATNEHGGLTVTLDLPHET